ALSRPNPNSEQPATAAASWINKKTEHALETPVLSATVPRRPQLLSSAIYRRAGSDANRTESQRLCDEPQAAGEQGRACRAGNRAPGGNELLGEHQYRNSGDPQHVHHAADEEQRHEYPAAADAIAAVAHAERERAAEIGTKPAMALNEEPGRLALAQADVLERRPLIKAGPNQHRASEDIARSLHRRCEQSTAFQRPLRRGCGKRKAGPGREIAGGKIGARRQ